MENVSWNGCAQNVCLYIFFSTLLKLCVPLRWNTSVQNDILTVSICDNRCKPHWFIKQNKFYFMLMLSSSCVFLKQLVTKQKKKKGFSVQELMGTFADIIHDWPFIESWRSRCGTFNEVLEGLQNPKSDITFFKYLLIETSHCSWMSQSYDEQLCLYLESIQADSVGYYFRLRKFNIH